MSLDQKEREREMVSRLLSDLYPDLLTTDDVVTSSSSFFLTLSLPVSLLCMCMCMYVYIKSNQPILPPPLNDNHTITRTPMNEQGGIRSQPIIITIPPPLRKQGTGFERLFETVDDLALDAPR